MKMGLDMYLFSAPRINGMNLDQVLMASRQIGKNQKEQDEIFEKVKPYIKHFNEYDSSWSSLLEEVASWRKANQIHHWFVTNIHNGKDEPCFTAKVTKGNLQELNNLCLKVLKNDEH